MITMVTSHKPVLLRQHLGAYFEKKGIVSAGFGHYKYIFQFEYPKYKNYAHLIPQPNCDNITWFGNQQCRQYATMINEMNNRRTEVFQHVKDKIPFSVGYSG